MLRAVEGKRMHPLDYFWSYDQWLKELDHLIDPYNDDRQDGRLLDGRTPNEAYKEFWPARHVTKADASCWHLVSHYTREYLVDGGISFEIGRNSFIYFDEALGPYNNRSVQLSFDPTQPQVLGVTDLNGKNPFFVARHIPPDVRASYSTDPAEREHFQNERRKQAGYMKHAKTSARAFKAEFNRTYRPNIVNRQTAALGQEMLTKRNEALADAKDNNNQRNRILSLCHKLGTSPKILRDFSDETEQALRRQLKRRESLADETEAAPAGTGRTYVLNSAHGATGSLERSYLDYLIGRLTEFRQAGASFGQTFSGKVTSAGTAKIMAKQLGASVPELAASRFAEAVEYLQTKIDATILGKRNLAKGVPNYHSFADHFDKATP